jgi:hypothetical protein
MAKSIYPLEMRFFRIAAMQVPQSQNFANLLKQKKLGVDFSTSLRGSHFGILSNSGLVTKLSDFMNAR